MPQHQNQVEALASIMEEFQLKEASLTLDGLHVAFKRVGARASEEPIPEEAEFLIASVPEGRSPISTEEVPRGTPVRSPMNGIFYDAPSPSAPPFVRLGETVATGQIIGLIEAMKVFNEIPCPVSGTVLEFVAPPGSLVQPGDVLVQIG